MTAQILRGAEFRDEILTEIKQEVAQMKEKTGEVPGLATILIGDDPASISYVTLKIKTAIECGFHEIQDNLPKDISETELLQLIEKYNNDPKIHGILVQLPLPAHINEENVINAINPDKDVDAFHPINVGRLMIGGDHVVFRPCTPAGIQEMLIRSGTETCGAEVVVIGRSNIVGKPIATMIMAESVSRKITTVIGS